MPKEEEQKEKNDQIDMLSRINNVGGYYNIMDSAINAALVTVMSGKALNINRKALMYIIMFASVGEIKDFIRWFLGRIRENGYGYVSNFYQYIKSGEFKRNFMNSIKVLRFLISLKFMHTQKRIPLSMNQERYAELFDDIKQTSLHIGDNHQVLDAILSYIDEDSSRGSYRYKIVKTDTTNLHERVDKILIYGIQLFLDNIKIFFKSDVFAEYTSFKDKSREKKEHQLKDLQNKLAQNVDSTTDSKKDRETLRSSDQSVNSLIMTKVYTETYKHIELYEPDIVSKKKTITTLGHLIDNSAICEFLEKHKDKISNMSGSDRMGKFDAVKRYSEINCRQQDVMPQSIVRSFNYVYSDLYDSDYEQHLLAELLILLYYADFEVRFTKDEIFLDKLNMSILYSSTKSWDMGSCEFNSQFKGKYIKYIEGLMGKHKTTFDTEFSKLCKIDTEDIVIKPDVTLKLEVCVVSDPFKKSNQVIKDEDLCREQDDTDAEESDKETKLPMRSELNKIMEHTPENGMPQDTVKLWNTHLYNNIIKSYVDKRLNVHNVTVYTLKIGEQIEETEVPNPDFLAYMHKKDMFESISLGSGSRGFASDQKSQSGEKDKKDSEKDQKNKKETHDDMIGTTSDFMMGMGLHNVPPQTIKKKTIKPIVISTKEGTVLKRLDTLYLRKADTTRLTTILRNFSECSDVYDDLCISKKLGIMLYGVPGTGKSSTIIAIATYLNYDIYYISLNGVNKNSQLKMIFDHVAKNCSKRGLMVFEDIDAQTDIVHKRTTIIKSTENGDSKIQVKTESLDEASMSVYGSENKRNDDLDLSFFLNNLDGTLSQQDMAYVMTTNHLERLDPALYRKGRIHAMIHLKKCDRYQIACIFEKIIKRQIRTDVLEKIPEDIYTPAEVIQHFLENIHNIDMTDQQIVDGIEESHIDFDAKNALLEQNIKNGMFGECSSLPFGIKIDATVSPNSDNIERKSITTKTDDSAPDTSSPEPKNKDDSDEDSDDD